MFTILGSGFGLYGYVPALFSSGEKGVILPKKYLASMDARPELNQFRDKIIWLESEEEALNQATGVVIARCPSEQSAIVKLCLEKENIKYLILEKPLSENPENAQFILTALQNSEKTYRISYIFQYLSWASNFRNLICELSDADTIDITWDFVAHHYQHELNNWKRDHSKGGGALRFFGIHLVALLAMNKYTSIHRSSLIETIDDDIEQWKASFDGIGLPRINIKVDTNKKPDLFHITANRNGVEKPLFSKASPFSETIKPSGIDPRSGPLALLIKSLFDKKTNYYSNYLATVKLWEEIEGTSIKT